MSEITSPDAGKKIEPLPSIIKAKKVMEEMQNLKLKKETVSFLKGLPPMLMQNGLGQTIAFIKSKAKDKKDSEGGGEKKDYDKILKVFNTVFGKDDLMKYILGLDTKVYIQMQKEAIEYAGWMKKFAIAFHSDEPEKEKKDAPAAP